MSQNLENNSKTSPKGYSMEQSKEVFIEKQKQVYKYCSGNELRNMSTILLKIITNIKES